MKNPVIPAALAILLAASFMLPAWSADPVIDRARVKQQAGDLPALQQAAAKAAGCEGASPVQGFDSFKTPAGAFAPHRT